VRLPPHHIFVGKEREEADVYKIQVRRKSQVAGLLQAAHEKVRGNDASLRRKKSTSPPDFRVSPVLLKRGKGAANRPKKGRKASRSRDRGGGEMSRTGSLQSRGRDRSFLLPRGQCEASTQKKKKADHRQPSNLNSYPLRGGKK